jgi:tripartite-type tricarboxylate transporter receptor subunit TctC
MRICFYAVRVVLAVVAISAAPMLSAGAAELDILKGQSIRAIIGGNAGAGTDVIARAFFGALGRALPGTAINMQNIPAGSGAGAVKELAEARGNLVTISIFGNGPLYAQLQSSAAVPYDLSKLHWLGSLAGNRRVLAMRKGLGAPKFETLLTLGRQPIAPTTNAVSPNHIEALLLNAVLGLRLKVVPGFSDGQIETMVLAGDGDIRISGSLQLAPMIEAGDMVPVLRFSAEGYPVSLQTLPRIADFALPGVPKDLVFLLETLNLLGRPYAAAPNTPPAVVAALRAAFEIAVKDPEYIAVMARNETVGDPTPGAQVGEAIGRLYGSASEIGPVFRAYLDCGAKLSDNPRATC